MKYINGKELIASDTVNLYDAGNVLNSTMKTEYLWGVGDGCEIPGVIHKVKLNGMETVGYTYDSLGRITQKKQTSGAQGTVLCVDKTNTLCYNIKNQLLFV